MDSQKLNSILSGLSREQKHRAELEVQVSQTQNRISCHNKYILELHQEEISKKKELEDAEIGTRNMATAAENLASELRAGKTTHTSMEITFGALRARKHALEDQLTAQVKLQTDLLALRQKQFDAMAASIGDEAKPTEQLQ